MSYVVSTVAGEPDAVFITQFWDRLHSQQSAFVVAGIYEVLVRLYALPAISNSASCSRWLVDRGLLIGAWLWRLPTNSTADGWAVQLVQTCYSRRR